MVRRVRRELLVDPVNNRDEMGFEHLDGMFGRILTMVAGRNDLVVELMFYYCLDQFL